MDELDDDARLLADWLTACEELAAAKQKTKELHALVQERRVGPYAPEAAWTAPAETEESGE